MKIISKNNLNFGTFILIFWLVMFNIFVIISISKTFDIENSNPTPKIANYWIVTNEIHINDNWSASEALYDFISGSGTYIDPFIIENITIKNYKSVNNAITIENSRDYFIVKNCKITGSGTSIYNNEINIVNSTKGVLINNTISSNIGTGISLIKSFNISIVENQLYNNTYIGLLLNESHNNFIYNNRANSQGKEVTSGFGITLFKSNNNSIISNIASYNSAIGILLGNSSYNNLTLNSANHNYLGIRLTLNSNYNNVIGNDLKDNTYCYIIDDDSEGNIFENNDCGSVGFEFYFFLIAFGAVFALALIGGIFAIKKRRKIKKERKINN